MTNPAIKYSFFFKFSHIFLESIFVTSAPLEIF